MRFSKRAVGAMALTCVLACGKDECPAGTLTGPGLCKVPEAGKQAGAGSGGRGRTTWPTFEEGGGGAGGVFVAGRGGAGGEVQSDYDGGFSTPSNPVCGNGILDPGEYCDGASCPLTCETGNKCMVGHMLGSQRDCDLRCESTELTICNSGDGCCPPGCDHTNDTDCSESCGDGKVEKPETCDGDCPTTCDDGDACTVDTMTGTAAQCSLMCGHEPAVAGKTKDGCCPQGSNISVDADCAASCGDGVVTAPETCDSASSKGCPSSCDDLNPCTTDSTTGSAATCDIKCTHAAVTKNVGGDGCCLPNTTEAEDSDCKVECVDATDCKPPSECQDAMCTNGKCGVKAKTGACDSGNGTCQTDGSCKANPKCGDGHVDPGEKCDGNCPAECPKSTDECKINGLNFQSTPCQAQCETIPATGNSCNSGKGVCDSTGKCVDANWYEPCSSDIGCSTSLACRPSRGYCSMQCSDHLGSCGSGGTCLNGWCDKTCSVDSGCAAGQQCLELDIGKVCRPMPCGASMSGVTCPSGFSCKQNMQTTIWECLPG